MRKRISLVLVFVLTLSMVYCAGLAESEKEAKPFTPTVTNLVKNQAKEWMASDDTRAMVTVLLIVDLTTEIDSNDLLTNSLTKASYIGKQGLDLVVYVHGVENDMLILYRPVTGDAYYMMLDVSKDEAVEIVMNMYCTDGFYKNDLESIYTVVQQLQELFSTYE